MDPKCFQELLAAPWLETFNDSGNEDWTQNWVLDGERAEIRNTPNGMVFSAGPHAGDHASHAVLWTQNTFAGNLKIEFDFTRLDTINRYVNILYIQASGINRGPYAKDITTWAHLRRVPYMSNYFDNMHLLHISYAAFNNNDDLDNDYIRIRRYPRFPEQNFNATEIKPDILNTGLFLPGIPYHFTLIKTDSDLFFEVRKVEAPEEGNQWHWSLEGVPPLSPGPIGIRHMWKRCSCYRNIQIATCQ